MILVLSNPRRKSCAAISKESSLSAVCSNRPGYERRCAFSADLVDVFAETLVDDIHLTQSSQNFRCAGVEMVGDEPVSYTHLDVYKRQIPQSASLTAPFTQGSPGACKPITNPMPKGADHQIRSAPSIYCNRSKATSCLLYTSDPAGSRPAYRLQ